MVNGQRVEKRTCVGWTGKGRRDGEMDKGWRYGSEGKIDGRITDQVDLQNQNLIAKYPKLLGFYLGSAVSLVFV